jgi:transposase
VAFEGIDRKQLEELAEAGASVTVPAALLLALINKIEMLEEEVAELKRNSRNSSKPPSSDRGKPNGTKGGAGDGKGRGKRKQGGQPGHGGHTLRRTANPDNTVTHHLPASCGHCGAGLAGAGLDRYDTRQVFDLPAEIKVEVTEHRAAVGTCTCCGKRVKAQFPEGVSAPVQYGARIRALVVYLHVYQLLPCGRLSELCADVFNCRLSPGTVANLLHGGGSRAGPLAEKIKGEVRGAPFMHLDETGMNLFGKNHWLHTASTPRFTYLHIDAKRGREALEATGVLEGYTGWAIHDFFPSYYHYAGCGHGLCNAHHLRDLTYVDEELGQRWAGEMIGLLLEAKAIRDR